MPVKKTDKIWHNGKLIPWDDAKIHVLSHVIHYGSSVFEGIRCYETKQGPATFRLRDHMQRLVNSGRIYYMDKIPYTVGQLCDAAAEVVRANRMNSCYLRARVVLRGYGDVGVSPLKCRIEVYIACWGMMGRLSGALSRRWSRAWTFALKPLVAAGAEYACRPWPRPPRTT